MASRLSSFTCRTHQTSLRPLGFSYPANLTYFYQAEASVPATVDVISFSSGKPQLSQPRGCCTDFSSLLSGGMLVEWKSAKVVYGSKKRKRKKEYKQCVKSDLGREVDIHMERRPRVVVCSLFCLLGTALADIIDVSQGPILIWEYSGLQRLALCIVYYIPVVQHGCA